jgi:fructose-1,6-bisphosphatase II / sedoheptulose-1,7-bisphosphatase
LGGAPEGVLAAAALKCVGGQFQGRLVIRSELERERAERTGIRDLSRRYTLDELVTGEAVFIATGVTSGTLLDGERFVRGHAHTHTMMLNAATGTVCELRMRQPI